MKIGAQARRRPKMCFPKMKTQILMSVECDVLDPIAKSFCWYSKKRRLLTIFLSVRALCWIRDLTLCISLMLAPLRT
jgi:hypothetical protein